MYKLFFFSLIISLNGFSQLKSPSKKSLEYWGKSVINLECQGYIYPKYFIDSVIQSYNKKNAPKKQLDSISNILNQVKAFTGSAVYVSDGNKRYLITAKHVLLDKTLGVQKAYETKAGIKNWSDNMEAIYSVIMIRTPLDFNLLTKKFNSGYVTNNNFISTPNERPYIFIPNSTGDDIAIVSLREKNYKVLDKILQENGYIPVDINTISTTPPVEVGDAVFTVGFPETISVTGLTTARDNNNNSLQIHLVSPFTTIGTVAMNDNALNFFYTDITIIYGNSGGPVICNNKLVSLISSINLYQITTDEQFNILQGHLAGIGHFVKITKMTNVLKYLRMLQDRENSWQ